jgi:glycine oxidase
LFAEHSRRLYLGWLEEISEESGLTIPYLDSGLLQVAIDEAEASVILEELVPEWNRQGFVTEVLSPEEVIAIEPALTLDVRAACRLPAEGALEPRKLLDALATILERDQRIEICLGTPILSMEPQGDSIALTLSSGLEKRYDRCILAAGFKSPELLPQLAAHMLPVRGQALDVRTQQQSYPLRHHIYGRIPSPVDNSYDSAYLVPRADGRVTIGVTYERDETHPTVTAGGLRRILDAASRLVPSVDEWEVVDQWAGIRPGTVDGRPFIGFADPAKRLIVATGHFGVGVTLAPATAEMIKDLVVTGDSEMWSSVNRPPE